MSSVELEVLDWQALTARGLAEPLARLRGEAWAAVDGELDVLSGLESWLDPYDVDATHVLAWSEGALIGAGRLHLFPDAEAITYARLREAVDVTRAGGLDVSGPIACLSRLVVTPDWHGKHVGVPLRRARLDRVAQQGGGLVLLWTKRPKLIRWHVDAGWTPTGQMDADFSRAGVQERTTVLALRVPPVAAPSEPGVS